MRFMKKSVLAAAVLVGIPFLAGNTVYQWTDENGVVHFSQMAPKDKNQTAVETNIRSAAMTGGTFVSPSTETEGETESRTTTETQPAETYKKNPEACARAREMLTTLNTGQRLRLRDPDTGEITYASDTDLAEQRRRAVSQIERDC